MSKEIGRLMKKASKPTSVEVERPSANGRNRTVETELRAVAINYHFIRDHGVHRFALRAHEKPGRFAQQISELAEEFYFCRARDLVYPNRDIPPSSVILTFDDGTKDVVVEALPVLRRLAATATVFVSARPYLEGRLLDAHKIEFLIRKLSVAVFGRIFYAELERQFPNGTERESLDFARGYQFYRYDDASARNFKLDLNYRLPYARVGPALDCLFRKVFGEHAEGEAVRETYLSLDDLKRLLDAGFELGSHTNHHWVLPRLAAETQYREIETGVEFLRELTGEDQFTLAYPFGFHDGRTEHIMKEVGILAGVTMGRRTIEPEDIVGRWNLPRYDVNDCFDRESNRLVDDVFSKLRERGPTEMHAGSL